MTVFISMVVKAEKLLLGAGAESRFSLYYSVYSDRERLTNYPLDISQNSTEKGR